MINEHPNFKNDALCAYAPDPDLWFPEEHAGRVKWSQTPSANEARAICRKCPAKDECLEYSIQFIDLSGIWAGMDRYERRAEQILRGVVPRPMNVSLPSDGGGYTRVQR